MSPKEAYDDGVVAFQVGLSRNTCPFPSMDMKLRPHWLDGWDDEASAEFERTAT